MWLQVTTTISEIQYPTSAIGKLEKRTLSRYWSHTLRNVNYLKNIQEC
jgi:hypothetical protein